MADQQITRPPVTQQLGGFFRRLTRLQLFTMVGVAAASIIGLLLMVNTVGDTPMSVLFSDLEQKDVALIVEKLKERGIEYELVDKGSTVMAPTSTIHETRLALASEGLPGSSVVGYEIFDKTNLGMSDFVQRLNFRRALEGELSRTIGTLDEVKRARVHIVIPERALFEDDQRPPTASVVLELKSGKRVSRMNVEGVQNLVASSVEGMDPTQVSVIDQRGRILSEAQKDQTSLAGLSSTQYEQKQRVDEYFSRRVQGLLDEVLGVNNSAVSVNVELDFTQVERTIEDFDPDRQVVRSEQIVTEQSASLDSLNFPSVNQEAQRGNTITNYEISKTVQRIVSGVGSIKRLSVAAFINEVSKTTQDANGVAVTENVPRSEEEMQQLRQIIRNAVGYDPARNDQISVVNVAFDNTFDVQEPLETPFNLPQSTVDIIEKAALIVAMLLAVFMIRKLISSPEVRRRIEKVLAPSDLEKQRVELAKAAAERQQKLLKGLVEQADVSMLPEQESQQSLSERARAKLDMTESSESAEESQIKREMRQRVQEYLEEKPVEAAQVIKTLLRQQQYGESRKK